MRIPALRFFAMPALLLGLFLAACHLGDDKQVEATLTFNQWYDSLSQYERVVISLKDEGGNTIDVLFDGQVKVPGDLEKLPAPHWDGSNTVVSIVGYKGGAIVYRTETGFNGNSGKKDSTYVIVAPDIGISTLARALPMLEGDSMNLPEITIVPSKLKVKDLTWTSSAPDVVAVGNTGFRALKAGTALITVALAGDATKSLVITITVVDPAKIPESIALSADTLKLSAGGSPDKLGVTFVPTTAAKDLIWTVRNTEIASVAADGTVQGLKAGETYLVATSSLKASVSDSALLLVSTPVPPLKVVFAKAETELFVGGAAESLLVAIEPPEANQDVEFSVTSATHLEVKNGRVTGLAEGAAEVIAKSKANPDLADTLKVKITVKQVINSVAISRKTLTIFTGGEETVLTASVLPATSNAKVDWRSSNAAAATVENGKLTAVAPGFTRIRAISVADSSKQDSADVTVKTDAPVVNIGRPDTTVSLGSTVAFLPVVPTQEYGVVVAYRWDVDGASGWDDTAKAVQSVGVKFDQEKEYTLRFYVRDTEGNETIAIKKVTAVNGPVVTIVSPVDGEYFTKPAIKIEWKIDNVAQTTGLDTVLKDGANVITRSAKDAAGKVFSTQITVYLDSVPPAKPLVKGPAAIASGKPMWTWGPGGGGNGIYRIAVDSQVFAGAGSKDTLYIPETALAEGSHTLFVQERDIAGNWSLPGSVTTIVDGTGPTKPVVKTNVASPTNAKRPVWSWSTGGGGGTGIFQYKMGSADFSTGASTPAADSQYTPAANLGDGTYTLYVRERDALGNWSEPGNAALTVDTTAPGAPKLEATSPTSSAPKWTWTSGGGGSGTYRFKVGSDPAGAPETNLLEYTHTGAVSKTVYILYVQERDAVGNWSPAANLSVFYDLSKPTVAFTAPAISGTYMTKSPTVDVAGTSSSPQGAGAVKSIAYTVDGVSGTLSTNLLGDGTWSIKALPLTNNKTIALKVTAVDVANNTGEATLNILMDNTAPAAPAFTAQPSPTIVNQGDSRTSLSWTWNQPAGTDSFVVRVNGVDVSRQVGTTHTINSISDGTYLVEVSGKDFTGNASGFTPASSVLVDRVAPSTPSVPTVTSPTRDNRPTWDWNSATGGSGNFEYRLASGANPTGAGTAVATDSYRPATGLADGTWYLQVRERDVANNWSNWSTSGIATIKVSAPSAPTVNRNANPTNTPKWTWSSGGGGNGTFRYRWNGSLSYLGEGTGTEYAPTNLSETTHNLCVSERDAIGYGGETCLSIAVDRTGPSISEVSVPDGFITNKTPFIVGFKRDGISDTMRCDFTLEGSKTCSKTVYDAANNPATVTRTLYWRKNVVFVRAGITGGDGSNWDAAYGEITTALSSISGQSGRYEIWVGEGSYTGFNISRSYTSLYGGFSSSGYPNVKTDRDFNSRTTRIRPDVDGMMLGIRGESQAVSRDAIVDGFQITGEIGQAVHIGMAENARLENVWIESNRNTSGGAGLIAVFDGNAIFDKVYIRDNYSGSYSALYLYSGGKADFYNSEITGNSTGAGWGGPGIHQEGGSGGIIRNTKLYKNAGGSNSHQVFNYGSGKFDIDGCTVQGERSGVYPTDDPNSDLIIWGPNNKPY